jgi:hypothetical protein
MPPNPIRLEENTINPWVLDQRHPNRGIFTDYKERHVNTGKQREREGERQASNT